MVFQSVVDRFYEWWDRRAALMDLRRIMREDSPYERLELQGLVDAVKSAAFRDDRQATLQAFNALRARAPEVAISSIAAIRSLVTVNELDIAEPLLADGLQKFPYDREFIVVHGDVARRRGDWPQMASRFAHMRKRFPDDAWGYLMGGVALKELEQFDQADRLLARAIALDPTFAESSLEYARLSERRGDLDQALHRWASVREQFQSPVAWLSPAKILSGLGRFGEAIELLRVARWRFANIPEPAVELAEALHRIGDLDAASKQWQSVRDQFPMTKEGFVKGAKILYELGRAEEANLVEEKYANLHNHSK